MKEPDAVMSSTNWMLLKPLTLQQQPNETIEMSKDV